MIEVLILLLRDRSTTVFLRSDGLTRLWLRLRTAYTPRSMSSSTACMTGATMEDMYRRNKNSTYCPLSRLTSSLSIARSTSTPTSAFHEDQIKQSNRTTASHPCHQHAARRKHITYHTIVPERRPGSPGILLQTLQAHVPLPDGGAHDRDGPQDPTGGEPSLSTILAMAHHLAEMARTTMKLPAQIHSMRILVNDIVRGRRAH